MSWDQAEIARDLSYPGNSVHARTTDGVYVHAQSCAYKMKVVIVCTINGKAVPSTFFSYQDRAEDLDALGLRFFAPTKVLMWNKGKEQTPKGRALLRKMGINPDKARYHLNLDWRSPQRLAAYWQRQNTGITRITLDEYWAAVDAMRAKEAA